MSVHITEKNTFKKNRKIPVGKETKLWTAFRNKGH